MTSSHVLQRVGRTGARTALGRSGHASRDLVPGLDATDQLRGGLPQFAHPDWVALQTRQSGLVGTGEIRLREPAKESLRMRPSRIIVGEVRAEECLDMLLR